ncbi:hypothetical protein BJ741DRAFT_621006 [Chytriomyces cf. hyalinus JEL632]|nr:hypothetical protein BJ741DRAFT_621006 [Chytriomyces cf. hyalinus JEL632]
MSVISFVPQQLRRATLCNDFKGPKTTTRDSGIVAIIDISGYSKLSSHLQEVLGSDSGAKIKELLNPPIEIIIREVHRTGGSIVKFAGDAVIAVWTHSAISLELTQNMIIGALSCCVQLLDRFRNYTISFLASAQQEFAVGRPSTRTSVVKVPHSAIQEMKTQKLKIHIGLGFGVTHDIHLGVQINAEPVRSEFFLSGTAMAQSGQLLGEGSEGDLVLGESCWDQIKSMMPAEFSESLELFKTTKNENAFRLNERENLSGLIHVLSEKLDNLDTNLLDTGSESVPVAEVDFKGQLAAILPYVDEALHHAVSTAKSLMDVNLEPERYFEVLQCQTRYILNNYDQTRKVCIIFIQFQGFNVEAMHEAESVNKLQSIMKALVKSIRKYQGCLRQINCDDKSLTALLVWGLQGFAHEKNETEYVLPAAVEIASRLAKIVGTDFSIGVTSGSVFSGIVGDENRADGTVLGVAVNNAARIMCLPICRGAVLCDEETFMNASESYQFDETIPKVELKGVPRPVKVYKPLESKNRCRITVAEVATKISGRDKELGEILSSYAKWCQSERQRFIITGRSGAGKTALMHFYHSLLDINPNVISCVGKGQEHHQNTMLFCYSQILSDLFKSVADRNINLEKIYRRDSWSKSHMTLDEYFTTPHTGTRDSLCSDTSIHDFIVRTFPPLTWEIWGSVPNLMKQSREKKPAVGDLVTKLAILLSRVLNALHKLDLRVCFTLDDTQWCDSYSIDLTQKLQHSCGRELFLIFSRPQEEFKPSLVPEFRRIIEAPATTHIALQPLDFAGIEAIVKGRFRHLDKENNIAVDPIIVMSILEQSEGNSMLVTSSITLLQEDSNIVLKNGVLTFREAMTGQTLAGGNDSIILAQFDKLCVEMKGILRVASVAGQYFDIDEVRDIMNQSQLGSDITSDKISSILESADPYQFVKRTEKLNIRMFSHFLIQQAIQAAMVPLKRASIHKLFADYYEITLNDENRSSHLQALIFHLFKLPGEEIRKQTHVYSAFMDSAESFRCKEAFEYYGILNSFVPKAEFAITPIDKAREHRLLAQLYFETKEPSKAVDGIFKGLAILGFMRPPKTFGKLKVFVKATLLLQKLAKSSKQKQERLCRKFVFKMFPKGFEEYLKHLSKAASSQPAFADHFNIIIEEIMLQLEFVTKPLVVLADSFDTLMVASLLSVIGFLALKYQPIRSALCWARIAASYAMVGLVSFSEKAAAESSKVLEGSGFSRSSSNLSSYATDLYARIYDARGLTAFGASRFRATADCFMFQNELNEAIGIEHTSKAYYNRNMTHISLVIGGYFSDYAAAIDKGAQFFEESEERQFDVACLQLVRAVYESNQLNYSECLGWLNKCLPFIRRDYSDGKSESPTLTMFLESFLLSIGLQQMGLAKTSAEFCEWQDKCCENAKQIIRVVRVIFEGKKTNFMHGCWIYLCPLVCEWVFLGKSVFGSSEVAMSTSSLLLAEMKSYFKKSRPKRPSGVYLSAMQRALADLRKGNPLKFQKCANAALAIAKGKDYLIEYFEAQMRSRMIEASLVYGTKSSSDAKVQAELVRLHTYFTEGQSLREADRLAKYLTKE